MCTPHAQVLAFSGGQRKEEDLTSALVAAVVAARRQAGTYGVETLGEPPLHFISALRYNRNHS